MPTWEQDLQALPAPESQVRLGRIVALANANTRTPGADCYVSTYTVRFVDATFDPEDSTPTLTLTNRSASTTVTAIAPADMDPVVNQTVLLAKIGANWYLLQEYCDSVTYFPNQDCNPFDCASSYFPDYSGDCAQVPEFGWGVDFGTLGAGCCGGNANGRVCLTNDASGDEWLSATFDCGESETAFWVLDTGAGTLKLKTVTAGTTLVQYNLISSSWCCMCSNKMRLACPPDDPCAIDWPVEVCVTPNSEYCVGGEECDYTLYDFTTVVSGFSGGCCGEYDGTWVMTYNGVGVWSAIKAASCDAYQRFAALTQVGGGGVWQVSFQPAGPGSDIVTYTSSSLSCTEPTVFTRVSNGCAYAPDQVTVTPSLAA